MEHRLNISAEWDLIAEDYSDIVKQYAKYPIKGFRPGKVPTAAVESVFRNEIRDDLVSSVSTRLCRQALKDEGLEAGTPIEVSEIDFQKNKGLKFVASFIEMPKFELPDYRHLDLQETDEVALLDEVSEKLLDRTIIELHPSFIDNELKYAGDDTDDPEEQRALAEDRARLMLILKKIAVQDNIEVSDREIEQRIAEIAEENDATPEELKDFFMANNGMPRLIDSILAEQTLQYIISEQEKPEDNKPSAEIQ